MRHDYDKIRATGAALYVVGNGAPNFIAGFRQTTGYTGPIYTDPSLAAYRAAHLKRGRFITPALAFRSIRALARGFRQATSIQGDADQQGGVLVVDTTGRILWQHISQGAGDNASPAEIIRALHP